MTWVKDYRTPKATIIGGTLLVVGYDTEDPDQRPVMVVRGSNVRQEFAKQIFVGELFDKSIEYLKEFAQKSSPGLALALPKDPTPFLALTNNPHLFYHVREHYYDGKIIKVGSRRLTEFNGMRIDDRSILIGD